MSESQMYYVCRKVNIETGEHGQLDRVPGYYISYFNADARAHGQPWRYEYVLGYTPTAWEAPIPQDRRQ